MSDETLPDPLLQRRRERDRLRKRQARAKDAERRASAARSQLLRRRAGSVAAVLAFICASFLTVEIGGRAYSSGIGPGAIGPGETGRDGIIGQAAPATPYPVPVPEDPENRRILLTEIEALKERGDESLALLAALDEKLQRMAPEIESVARTARRAENRATLASSGLQEPPIPTVRAGTGPIQGAAKDPNRRQIAQAAEEGQTTPLGANVPVIDLTSPVQVDPAAYPFFPQIAGPSLAPSGSSPAGGAGSGLAEGPGAGTAGGAEARERLLASLVPDTGARRAGAGQEQIEPVRAYEVRAGEMLHETLNRWTEQAGWSLVYEGRRSFPIEANAVLEARLVDTEKPEDGALAILFRSHHDPHLPVPDLYLRNRTIVIRTGDAR